MKLTDYIKGHRHGREAHLIEREAMRDPLLQDALDGFDTVPGDHEEALHRLRQKLTARVQPGKRRENRNLYRIAMAACIAGVVATACWMLWPRDNEHETLLAYETEVSQETASDTVSIAALPAETEITAIPESEKIPSVITDNIQIVDNNTDIETQQVFAEFDFDAGFSEAASVSESEFMAQENAIEAHDTAAKERVSRPKEGFVGNARIITGDMQRREDSGNVTNQVRNLDPTFYIAENNLPGSDPNARPIVTMRGETSLALMATPDSLSAVTAFYEHLARAKHPREGRVVLEFTANANGRPAKIHIIESEVPDKSAERAAIRLLRDSPIIWPHRKTIRVVVE